MNDGYRLMLGDEDWSFLEVNSTQSTVASQQYYQLAANMLKLKIVSVLSGNIRYTPQLITSQEEWNKINVYSTITSNAPQYYFVRGGQQGRMTVGFWPIPSSTVANAIEYTYKKAVKPLALANYTTGTIISIANADTAVVGSGTTWNVSMIGKFIQFTETNTANGGDGLWYEISAVPSTTTLTLLNPYLGTSIAAGTASYVIGSVPVLPEEYQTGPVEYAAWKYWATDGNNANRAKEFQTEWLLTKQSLADAYMNKVTDPILSSSLYQQRFHNANNYPWAT